MTGFINTERILKRPNPISNKRPVFCSSYSTLFRGPEFKQNWKSTRRHTHAHTCMLYLKIDQWYLLWKFWRGKYNETKYRNYFYIFFKVFFGVGKKFSKIRTLNKDYYGSYNCVAVKHELDHILLLFIVPRWIYSPSGFRDSRIGKITRARAVVFAAWVRACDFSRRILRMSALFPFLRNLYQPGVFIGVY